MADEQRKQMALDWPAQPSYLASDYVVGACNRAAHALITRWPDWPHFALALHGPAGAGKTHLAHIWAASASAGLADLTALRAGGPQAMADANRRWVIELDLLTPGRSGDDERALFHLHNLIQQAEGAMLFVSEEPPAHLDIGLPDLRSRLLACPTVGVGAPDDDLLAAVMVKLAADRQIVLSDPVLTFLAPRIERSFASVARIVRALDNKALAARRSITAKLAGEVLDALAEEDNRSKEDR